MSNHLCRMTARNCLTAAVIFVVLASMCILNTQYHEPRKPAQPPYTSAEQRLIKSLKQLGTVELTVRFSTRADILKLFFCDFLRSASVFWHEGYGPVTLILDEGDRNSFLREIQKEKLPFKFRLVYESYPDKSQLFMRAHQHMRSRTFGYSVQLYSSFLMDMYTNASVIAWADTDVIFTTVVTPNRIYRNGKLQVLGMNTYHLADGPGWVEMTKSFLGVPYVADFMTFFPVYLYPSTIKNCREFIMKRFNRSNFMEAFVDGILGGPKSIVSSVNVILSYAFHFEKDLYEFHIDLWKTSLDDYNNKYLLPGHFLRPSDLQPDLHVAFHSKYFRAKYETFSQAICHTRKLLHQQIGTVCTAVHTTMFETLYSFDTNNAVNHMNTWCAGTRNKLCTNVIQQHEFDVVNFKNVYPIPWNMFNEVENLARKHNIQCPRVNFD